MAYCPGYLKDAMCEVHAVCGRYPPSTHAGLSRGTKCISKALLALFSTVCYIHKTVVALYRVVNIGSVVLTFLFMAHTTKEWHLVSQHPRPCVT